jgi:tetratricopeptide (TPR) repeat protein
MRTLLLLLVLVAAHAGDAATSLFDRVLRLQHVQEPELDDQAMRTAFDALVATTRTALMPAMDVESRIAVLNRTLLAEREVAYLSNQYWRDSTLAASLLRKQGNCLATSTLYVLIGERLDLPIRMVVVPGHAFVRWDDGAVRRNIETTAGGGMISDADYLYRQSQCDPADVEVLGWGKSLTSDEFYAELVDCAAQHRIGQAQLEEAKALLDEAERLTPARSDRLLAHIQLRADMSKNRAVLRLELGRLLEHGNPPPSVATGALMMLAEDAAGRGDIEGQRRLLMMAFREAPKSALQTVLRALAFCCRTLRDTKSARRYMELALVLTPDGSPTLAEDLYNYAILQKNDRDLDGAIATVRRGRALNPESWNLQMLEAGYLMLAGKREEAAAIRSTIVKPRGEEEFWRSMEAWYLAVSGEHEAFLSKLGEVLEQTNSLDTIVWIDQDEDLDPYRQNPRFLDLLRIHRERLGAHAPTPTPAPTSTPATTPAVP